MEDIKKNESSETIKDTRFDRIKELARALPDGDGTMSGNEPIIDFVLKPVVKIDRDRYDELIRKEEQLNVVLKAIKHVQYSSELADTIKWILYDDVSDGEGNGDGL